ncbi:hypothetical protein QTJ16_003068 [Diplocarpon rosae]|uniref:Uncharacterized protein n=1 Tax=Diplocarpon rosae TaxID=946125 RepID=A0AAD9T0Y1_9HELO|nr:hypothetical protein QTJ16_003068 [Diplocarpon rosae]
MPGRARSQRKKGQTMMSQSATAKLVETVYQLPNTGAARSPPAASTRVQFANCADDKLSISSAPAREQIEMRYNVRRAVLYSKKKPPESIHRQTLWQVTTNTESPTTNEICPDSLGVPSMAATRVKFIFRVGGGCPRITGVKCKLETCGRPNVVWSKGDSGDDHNAANCSRYTRTSVSKYMDE